MISFIVTGKVLSLAMDWHEHSILFWTSGICLLVMLAVFNSYPAKALNAVEKGTDIDINDYFGDTLALVFWPIGIWFIQPRINRIESL